LKSAEGSWALFIIPFNGNDKWTRGDVNGLDMSHVDWIEIHLGAEKPGMTFWLDALGFKIPFAPKSDPSTPPASGARAAATPNPQFPPFAIAPFDETTAKEYQQAWARRLGVPVEITNSIGMKMTLIPPGEFMMGSPNGQGDGDEHPQHRVRLTKAFYLGAHEVTLAQLRLFAEKTGFKTLAEKNNDKDTWRTALAGQTDEHPAVFVSWTDAFEFCRELGPVDRVTYRLPTEAEWEYACRAGTTTRYYHGNDARQPGEYCWDETNSGGKTHPVSQKRPNAWGLFDMLGNVWECCADWDSASYYSESPLCDPTGPASGAGRAMRGASVLGGGPLSPNRGRHDPLHRDNWIGFRVVREIPSDAAAGSPGSVNPEKAPGTVPAARRTATGNTPWLGYIIHQDTAKTVAAVAEYTNIIVDTSWATASEELFVEARRAKRKVVLAMEEDYVARTLNRGIPLAKKYPEVIQAFYLISANENGLSDPEIKNLGQKIKQSAPETGLWVGFPALPGRKYRDDPVPDEIDALVVEIHFAKTPLLVESIGNEAIPCFLRKAAGRPVILMWTSWTRQSPGLVPDCSTGTFEKCNDLLSTYHLAGLVVDSYGPRPLLPNVQGQGVETRIDLASEIKNIARKLGIAESSPSAAGSPSSTKADTGSQAAGGTQAKWNSAHWFGYSLGNEPGQYMPEVASYTNLVWDYSWELADDPRPQLESTLKSARKHRLSVIVSIGGKSRLDKFLEVGVDLVRAYPDVVVGVCATAPLYFGVTPQDYAAFCARAKKLLPEVKLLTLMGGGVNDPYFTYPIPDEVDVFTLDCIGCTTAEEARRQIKELFPRWLAKAGKRPVLLAWDSWNPTSVSQCQPGVFRTFAEFSRKNQLAGFIVSSYGTTNQGGQSYVPLNTRPELVQEMRDIGKEWGVGAGSTGSAKADTGGQAASGTQVP
jgi:formylglycine-generating enzyme required for sulfatase activity